MSAAGPLEMFAVAAPGLEEIIGKELRSLGIAGEIEPGGVSFTGEAAALMRANLHLRCASRVLVRVGDFRARSFIELERYARRLDWTPWLKPGTPIDIRVSSRKSKLYHERGIAERFGRWMAEDAGTAEDQGEEDAQRVVVRLFRDRVQVSVDSSGRHLRFRGYREALAKAPLRENIAAALLMAAGWEATTPLLDPFCGSGTIPIEAALLARRIAPGLARASREPREYAFQHWPGYDGGAWDALVAEARRAIRSSPVTLYGSDRDSGAIEAAMANAERAGIGEEVVWEQAAISSAPAPEGTGHLVTNPPYGVRVGDDRQLRDLYAAFGKLAASRWTAWTIGMLAASDPLLRRARLPTEPRLRTRNGGIEVKFVVREPAGDVAGRDQPSSSD